MKSLSDLLVTLLAGCTSFTPKPLDPAAQQTAFESRRQHAVGSGFTVQVAMSRTKEEEVIAAYRQTLWLTVSAALVIAVVVGYLIARRGLTPVSRLASIVTELSAAHLHRRIGNDAWPRELRPLAANFRPAPGAPGRIVRPHFAFFR